MLSLWRIVNPIGVLKMKKIVLLLAMCCVYLFIFAYSLPLTLCEQVQEADYILKGRIESKETVFRGKASFVCTRYKLNVEKDLLGNYQEQELYFILAGGDDGEKKFRVSDVPVLEIGETSIFMLYKPEKKYFSLIVGGEQGRYTKFSDPGSGRQLVLDLSGKPMQNENGEQITFSRFEAELERDIPDFRSRPHSFIPPDPNGNPNNLNASDFLRWDNSDKRGRVSMAVDPTESINYDQGPEIGQRNYSPFNGQFGSATQTTIDRYVYNSYNYFWSELPTVFNQLPSNYNILGLRDQAMMANWNKYVKTYKVRSSPTGTFGYPDFENDICGFVDNATYEDVFDETWGPTELAVCFYWGIIDMWETDIAVNPAWPWTNDNSLAYNSGFQPTDQSLLHELGHAWGGGHNFNDLSVMNYYDKKCRTYSVVYNSDADGIRYKYPNDINMSNLGVHAYNSTGEYQTFNPAISDSVVTPGSNLRIRWITVENTGLNDMPLQLDVLLTWEARNWSGATYLTTLDLGTVSAESSNIINDLWVNIPISVRPGYYHVALRVATGGDAVVYDNASWIQNVVRVTEPPVPGLWIGGLSTNWHRAANWSGNFIPDSTTDVLIPSGCLNNPQIIQSEGYCHNITIESGAVLSIDYNSTFYGDVANSGMIFLGNSITNPDVVFLGNFENRDNGSLSFSYGAGILRVQGSWTEHPNSSTDMHPNGTLQFIGAGTSNLILQSTNSLFNNLEVQKDAGGSVIFSSACTANANIQGQLLMNPNNTVYYQSNQDMLIYGNLACPATSTFEALSGTIHMLGMGGAIEMSNTSILNTLNINSYGMVTMYSDLRLNGDLMISNGSLNAGYHNLYIKGSWYNNVGLDAFLEETSNVIFNGDEDQNLYTETFYSFTVNKPGGRIMMRPGSTINTTNYTYYSGELLLTGAIFNIADITNDGIYGTYRLESGEINLHQDAVGSIDLNADITMYDGALRIYGGSSSCWFAGRTDASLTMYGGTIDVVDQSIYINNTGYAFDSIIGGGTIRTSRGFIVGRSGFNPTNLIVELYGPTNAYVSTAEGSSLFHLIINKSGREGDHLRSNTIFGTERLAIQGNLMISAGGFSAPQTLYINGNWLNMVGPDAFLEGTGTVVFQGSEHQYCTTENFNNLRLCKVGGALRVQTAIVSCNSYEWQSGAVDLIFGNFTALDLAQDGIYGDFYVNVLSTLTLTQDSASYVDLNGTINMLGGECHVYGGSVISWWGYTLPATVNMTGGLIYFHDQGIEIPDSATLNITGGTIRTDGSFNLNKENYLAANWTLYLSGSQDTGLWLNNNSCLNHLVIDKSSDRESQIQLRNRDGIPYPQTRENAVYANTNLRIYGNFSLNSGSFHAPALIEVKGNWAGNPTASYDANGGRVLFTGDQLSQISLSTSFYDLEISKQLDGIGAQITANQNVTIEHNLVISDGALGVSTNNSLTVGGDLSILEEAGLNLSGESIQLSLRGDVSNLNSSNTPVSGFYAGASLVLLEGSEDQFFNSPSVIDLNDLRIDTYNGANFRPNRGVRVHDLEIIHGGYYSTPTGDNLSITGDLYVHYNGRWWDHANVLFFTGNEEQTIRIDAPADSCWFNYVTLDKPSRTEGGRSQDVYLLSDLELRNQGTLMIIAANLDLNGHTVRNTGIVDVNVYGTLRMPEASALQLGQGLYVRLNGNLIIAGSEESPVSISNYGSTWPCFQVENNGRISAEWGIFEYLNMSGVNIMSGAMVDPLKAFNHCSFLNGQSGGSALTLNDSGSYTVTGVNFGDNGWGSGYNVTKTLDLGEAFFASCQGSFSGPAFENDAYGRIQWNDFKADLIVSSAAWNPASVEIGSPATLTATIKNNGVVASGQFYLDLIRNLSLPPEFGYTADNSLLVPSLAAGDSTVVSFENIVWGVMENWQSWLIVDASGAVPELNENDNITGPYLISWINPPLPNIYISGLQWSQNPALIGGTVDLTVYITNSTTVAISEPIDIDLYLNPATLPDGSISGDLVFTILGGLGSESSTSYTFIGISSELAANWQSYVILNRTHSFEELDFTDNLQAATAFAWQDLPVVNDLQIAYDDFSGNILLSWSYTETVSGFNIYCSSVPDGGIWTYLGYSETTGFQTPGSESKSFFLVKAVNIP